MADYIIILASGLMIGFMFFILTLSSSMNQGYQQGQIDYANGEVMIHKIENENGELVWEWIDEPKYD